MTEVSTTTLHICMVLALGFGAMGWRPRRGADPGRRGMALLIAANLIVLYGMYRYLLDAGYVGHFLGCVLGLPIGGTL